MIADVSPFLYPRLPLSAAMARLPQLAGRPPDQLVDLSATHVDGITYAAIGGNRVGEERLRIIQQQMRLLAQRCGYPEPSGDASRRTFDAKSGALLHEVMRMTPVEAASPGVWAFMGCVLLPDVVRWRFPGQGATTDERFLGRSRGLRNTFGRVWWRAHVLGQPDCQQRYRLLEQLGEDELVQIMERPTLAASPMLARQVALTFLDVHTRFPMVTRSDLLRDAVKRLRRLASFVSFEALDETVLHGLTTEVFVHAATMLSGRR